MTDAISGPQDEWSGILDAGEVIVWQGHPDAKLVLTTKSVLSLVFGVFFAGFALIWMILASSAGGVFWMFGLLHFGVGLSIAFGPLFWGPWERRHTWYTLTDRRAFIAKDLPIRGRSLKSYPITAATKLELRQGTPGSVMFDHTLKRGKNGHYEVAVGFERIEEAADVFGHMRSIQERLTQ